MRPARHRLVGSDVMVVALGGNAISRAGDPPSVEAQFARTAECMDELAALLADDPRPLVITHGNGPQVGNILRRSELASAELPLLPFDAAVADTQGAMGYMIQQCLGNALRQRGIGREVVTVVTQVEVDPDDEAFAHPTKPIGSFMTEGAARQLASAFGWNVIEDSGRGWRRVVASPHPQRIVEEGAIRELLAAEVVVIACGGGGVPVVADAETGRFRGADAVIDKDAVSALVAAHVGAEVLAVLTGVEAVALDFGTPAARPVRVATPDEMEAWATAGHFLPGSMLPKVEAVIAFCRARGPEARAIITTPELLGPALRGQAGTQIRMRA